MKIPEDLKVEYECACAVDYDPNDSDSRHWRHEKALIERIACLEEREESYSQLLRDHARVHMDILRGDICLTKSEAIHIAGLPPDIDKLPERYSRKVKALRDIQHHLRTVAPQFAKYSGVWKIVEDALMDES